MAFRLRKLWKRNYITGLGARNITLGRSGGKRTYGSCGGIRRIKMWSPIGIVILGTVCWRELELQWKSRIEGSRKGILVAYTSSPFTCLRKIPKRDHPRTRILRLARIFRAMKFSHPWLPRQLHMPRNKSACTIPLTPVVNLVSLIFKPHDGHFRIVSKSRRKE